MDALSAGPPTAHGSPSNGRPVGPGRLPGGAPRRMSAAEALSLACLVVIVA